MMKHRRLTCIAMCLICVLLAANVAYCWRTSAYRAAIHAPDAIRLDKTKTVPISVVVTTPEGLPFFSDVEGQLDLSANRGVFVKTDGTTVSSPLSVPVVRGRVEATLSLEGYDSVSSPLTISVTRGTGDREVLGQVVVPIRYPERITLSASTLSVSANGVSRPTVSAVIEDQFGQPMEDVDVTARFHGRQGKDTLTGSSDSDGNANIELPTSTVAGYAVCQLVTERLASPMVTLVYAGSQTAMVPLREVADKMGVRLLWDATRRTVVASASDIELTVRVGDTVARYNGNPVPLGAPAQLTEGRVWVPLIFMREVAGYKG